MEKHFTRIATQFIVIKASCKIATNATQLYSMHDDGPSVENIGLMQF